MTQEGLPLLFAMWTRSEVPQETYRNITLEQLGQLTSLRRQRLEPHEVELDVGECRVDMRGEGEYRWEVLMDLETGREWLMSPLARTQRRRLYDGESCVRILTAKGGVCRAFLPPTDLASDGQVVADIRESLADRPGAWVDFAHFGLDRTDIRVVLDTEAPVRAGDSVARAIHVTTSEVVADRTGVREVLYRVVCGNGSVVPEFVSREVEEAAGVRLERGMRDHRGLLEVLSTRLATGHPIWEASVERMKESVNQTVSSSEIVDRMVETGKLSRFGDRAGIREALPHQTPRSTRFALVNALTLYAQERTGARRLKIEEAAHSVLVDEVEPQPRSAWSRLLGRDDRDSAPAGNLSDDVESEREFITHMRRRQGADEQPNLDRTGQDSVKAALNDALTRVPESV